MWKPSSWSKSANSPGRTPRWCLGSLRVAAMCCVHIWLCIGAARCQDEFPPRSIKVITGQISKEHDNKFLKCETNSNPTPSIRWLKDGVAITNLTFDDYLRINNILRTATGEYRCEASNKFGSVFSNPTHVEVAYMDQFTKAEQNISLVTNVSAALIIALPALNSYPVPDVTWTLNGQKLNEEGPRYHVTLDRSLVLLDREPFDNASYYQPTAINGNSASISIGPIIQVTVKGVAGIANRLPPSIVMPVTDSVAIQDKDVQVNFECVINARPVSDVDITWYKVSGSTKTKIVHNDSKYIISYKKRRLKITQPLLADEGTYQCEASLTSIDDSVTSSANLTVYVQPSFTSQFQQSYNRDIGQSITVACGAAGHPVPTIHWYFNTQPVSSLLNSRYLLNTDGSLTVSQLDLSHAGMYQCFIRNVGGETSKAMWLQVNRSPPVMLTSPSNLTVVEGTDAHFPCETQGAPVPVVTWSKVTAAGLEPISPQGHIQILDRGELLIASTLASDSGTYMCNASNSIGSVTAAASLLVFIATQIVLPPKNLSVIKGTNAEFTCGVSHDASITVTWRWSHSSQSNVQNVIGATKPRHSIAANGTLTITGINNNNIGEYTCDVVSAGGNDSRSASLDMKELPHKPIIKSVELDATDVRAVVVKWLASYDGNTPILRYSIQYAEVNQPGTGTAGDSDWMPYNLNIGADDRSATVRHLSPASFYQFRVFASNEVGNGGASDPKPDTPLEMPQQPPSAAPRGFYGVAVSNTSIRLYWQSPAEDTLNGPLLGYSILHKLNGYSNNTFQTVTIHNMLVNPTHYLIIDLAFFQGYDIMIAAYNAKGVGTFSNLIYVMTHEGHPTAAPRDFTLTAVNSTIVHATWKPPNQQFINGYNLGYKVVGRLAAMEGRGAEFTIDVPQDPANPTGLQETHITRLSKFTQYSVTVLCYTSQGDGPATSTLNVSTHQDVPGAVGQLSFIDIRDTSLKVVWTPPTHINGILLGYTLMYERKNETESLQKRMLSPTNLTYTIYGLNPTTWYTIYVHASTVIGSGPNTSASIVSGVPPELPQPPHNLGVSDVQARSAKIQFLPGFDGKTSITLWIVQAWEGEDASEWKDIFTIYDPDATSIRVQNLHPFTYYKLRILAENVVDKSNPSEPTRSFQTVQAAPGRPPGHVTARALNATALRISWTPLAVTDWNGAPRGYKIFYRMVGMAAEFSIVDLDNMNRDSAILAPLEEWIEYEVQMIAYNDVGSSRFSDLTVERTRESVPSVGPQDVRAVAVSSTSVNVTWGNVPLLDRNGMIQGFKVQYRSSSENIDAQFANIVGNTSSSALIENLRKFVQYEIRVLAYTRMGDGQLSELEVSVKTNADVPGPPVIIWFPEVTYTKARVIWNPPLEPNGIITGYMVSYRLNDSDAAFINSSKILPTERHHEVTGLQGEVHYVFRVTARTNHGWGATASVVVYTIVNRSEPDSPGKPSIMSSQVQARTVTISWVVGFNGYGPLRNFTVQYRLGSQQWRSLAQAIMPHVTTYTITGLRPNSNYVFRVAATNDIGTSAYSVQSDEVNTLEDLPEGAPHTVTVKPLTTTSVIVSWEQPLRSTWNGEIVGYIVRYRQTEMENYQEERVYWPAASKELSNLIKFVNYEFLVIAYNKIGDGPASTPVTVFVGEAAPTAPPVSIETRATNSTNSTEIVVSWLPPPADTHNGVLSGYKVSYWLAAKSESTARQMIVREQQALLQELQFYSTYAITLQAYNLAGEGPPSHVLYQKTMEEQPEPPSNLTFWNVTYVSLDVVWAPPVKPNGLVINYDLSYSEQSFNGGSKMVQFKLPGNVTHYKITGLLEGHSYKFSVWARTSVGQGHPITRSTTTGPQPGSPGRPLRPRFVSSDNTQLLTIMWDIGDPGETAIYEHRIQYKAKGADVWKKILEILGEENSGNISYQTLTPYDIVQFRVTAMNTISIGPYSDKSEFFVVPAPVVAGPERPFHKQPWFLVIVALAGLIVILVVILLLCLVGYRGNPKHKKAAPAMSMSNLTIATTEPEDGGFGNVEMVRQARRQPFAGIRSKTSSIYARSPPRPSPASVAYSDEDDTPSMVKPPIADDDTNSSITGKNASEFGDSSEASDESDMESIEPPLPPPPPPASPPPPPFSTAIRNEYINEPVQNTWQPNTNSSFNAYQYTDSEAESSHYAMSLNGGQIMMNNIAGSRAPLPGFSSFV